MKQLQPRWHRHPGAQHSPASLGVYMTHAATGKCRASTWPGLTPLTLPCVPPGGPSCPSQVTQVPPPHRPHHPARHPGAQHSPASLGVYMTHAATGKCRASTWPGLTPLTLPCVPPGGPSRPSQVTQVPPPHRPHHPGRHPGAQHSPASLGVELE